MAGMKLSRRRFLSSLGTLIVGFSLAPGLDHVLGTEASAASLTPELAVDSWLAIDGDSMVTIYSGKVELGTGVQTALTQIVAEELNVNVRRVRFVQGDTSRTPGDKGYTAGSKTIQNAGPTLRLAAATAFHTLHKLAAQRLDVPESTLYARGGKIGVGAYLDPALSYGELIGQEQVRLTISPPDPAIAAKDPSEYSVVGRSVPRVDLPAKVFAQFSYVHDLVLPNMLHGRVIRPSGRNATFDSIDETSLQDVRTIPGFLQVVQIKNFVGVVAADEWAAIQAARTLKVNWKAGDPLPDQASLPQWLQDPANVYQTNDEVNTGDADSALAGAAQKLHATYFTPFQMHGALGPSCAVADVRGAPDAAGIQVEIWSGTQGVFPLQGAIAQLLGLPATAVRVRYLEASGCYGHNGADDAAADAAVLSLAVGQPVRVQWMRQDEHGWEPLGPAMLHQMNGALDADGALVAWEHTVFSPTHSTRPGNNAGHLLAGQAIGFPPAPLPDAPRNNGTRNGPVNYNFTNNRYRANHVRYFSTSTGSRAPAAPLTYNSLRPSALRSLGGFSNTFANESFMDELAVAAGADPLEFRLRYLDDPRAIAVLNAMAETAAWSQPLTQPARPEKRRGRGIAFLRYESAEAYVAVYAEVLVNLATGVVQVAQVVVAHDCGLIINPNGVKNQIQGNVLQGISRTLKEEVLFDANGVTNNLWLARPGQEPYSILQFTDVPSMQIVLLEQQTLPSWGAGEATIGAVPAAIGNAIFNATGVRLRTLPLTPARVLSALASG